MTWEEIVEKYQYRFPAEQIAREPAVPRESAQLLVYDRSSRKTEWSTFQELPNFLPEGAVLVFNRTKVIPARLELTKPTGGKVRILYLGRREGGIDAMADRALTPGMVLRLNRKICFTVGKREGKSWQLAPSVPSADVMKVFEKYGTTPIPPYIKGSPLTEARLRQEYQAIFARHKGSVAAPTASLHFSKKLLREIEKRGFKTAFVTLHVNLGTFSPLTRDNFSSGRLHAEEYEIDAQTAKLLKTAKKKGSAVIAVGTTVARALESATDESGRLKAGSGLTQLFIQPGYRFRFVDGLVTNFHVPGSSLLMLVAAFIPRTVLLGLYQKAIHRKFRLFSFGDGMFIRP